MDKFILILISLRVLFDGLLNFSLLGFPISGFISVLILIMFLSTAFNSQKRKTTLIILVTAGLFSSAFYAFIELGLEPVYEAIRFTSILAAIHLVLNAKSELKLQNLLQAIGAIAYINFAMQVFQQTIGQGLFVNSVWRYAGLFAHPNTASLFYGFVLALAVYQLVSKSRSSNFFLISLIFVSISGIALTLSVGGIGFALISVFVVIISNVSPKLRFLTFGGVSAGLALVAIVFPNTVLRLNSFVSADAYVYGDQTNSLVWRFNQWALYYLEFERNPILGTGFGGSTSGLLVQNGLLPHNEYVRVIVETGVLGAAACLIFAFSLMRKLNVASKDESNWAARCASPLAIALGFNALTENTFLYTVPMLLMAVLIGSAFRQTSVLAST